MKQLAANRYWSTNF